MEGFGVVVTLAAGMGVVVLTLWIFVSRDGDADEPVDSVEDAHLRRVAEAEISSLAPGAIRLARKERGGGASGEDPAPAREFWRRFAAASGSVERDPAAALEELQGLPGLLEEALRGADREEITARGVIGKEYQP